MIWGSSRKSSKEVLSFGARPVWRKDQDTFYAALSSVSQRPLCSSGLESPTLAWGHGLSLGRTFFKNLDESFLNIPTGLVLLFFKCLLPWTAQLGLITSQQAAGCRAWPGIAAVCFSVSLRLLWFGWVPFHSFPLWGSLMGPNHYKGKSKIVFLC